MQRGIFFTASGRWHYTVGKTCIMYEAPSGARSAVPLYVFKDTTKEAIDKMLESGTLKITSDEARQFAINEPNLVIGD